ncbi:hypothetical protein FF2_022782 [Malus domestica]
MVCKLHKAIYGLKQSLRAWYAKLSSVLEKAGFLRSNADSSLFVRIGTSGKLVVLIYVDYLIITEDSVVEIEALKLSLHQTFAIKDLGRLKYLFRHRNGNIFKEIVSTSMKICIGPTSGSQNGRLQTCSPPLIVN